MSAGAGADKVLTTDASGVASWQTATAGATPGGSTGYVQFASSTSFAGDSNLFWDNTNKRLGIGTTTPQTKLDVAGAIKIGTQDICDSNAGGAIRYVSATKTFEGCDGTSWQQIKLFTCGDSVTFTYKGNSVTYGTVSSTGGKCWLDRNLGAARVATAYNDSLAYGDLFQWGRLDDGHQTRTSGTTTTLSSSDTPGHSNFIYGMASPQDWRSPQNENLWKGVSGTNNPCPWGWRIPTYTELVAESASWSPQDYTGAFASPLKLTEACFRAPENASIYSCAAAGFYWASNGCEPGSCHVGVHYGPSMPWVVRALRGYGLSVRCLKD